jgi:predicted dehydrogenase
MVQYASQKTRMNFLIVGLGSAGQRHARVLRALYPRSNIYVFRGTRFVGLIDKNLQNINLSIDPIFQYNLILLEQLDQLNQFFDLTVIATPASSHLIYVEKLWNSSYRILIEKPLSNSLEEISKLYKQAQYDNKIVYVGYQHNFNPIFNKIISIFNSYRHWHHLSCNFHESLHEMNVFRDMNSHHLADPNEGNAFLALSHEIDFVLKLLPGYWNKMECKLSSSGFFEGVLDEAKLEGIYENDKYEIDVLVSLNFGNVCKSREGILIGEDFVLKWDINNKTLNVNGTSENFDYDGDDLVSAEINFLLRKVDFDSDLKNSLVRAIKIVEINSLSKL